MLRSQPVFNCAAWQQVFHRLMRPLTTQTVLATCLFIVPLHASSDLRSSAWADGLSLSEFVGFIQDNNAALQVARNGTQIARETIIEEQGIFQPILSMSTRAERSRRPLSVDDQQTLRRTLDPYPSSNQSLEYGLSQLLTSGGTIKGITRLTREKTGDLDDYQLRGYVGVSFDQPLAQGFGEDIVTSDIRLAELGSSIADETLTDTQNSIIAEAITIYLDALRTQLFLENLDARLNVLTALQQESQALIEQGRMSTSTQLEIDTAIRQIEALRLNSQQELARFKGNMLSFAGSRLSGVGDFDLDVDAIPKNLLKVCELNSCIENAMTNRADLRAQQLRVDQAAITQLKAEDQQRAQMDLVVEVGFSEQANQANDAFEISELERHPDALIGLEIRTPLWSDKAAAAAVRRARMERINAELEVQDLKIGIENELSAQRLAVQQTAETSLQWQQMVNTYTEQLAIADSSLREGRGDIMAVLRAREAALNAKASLDDARIAHAQAWVRLMASQGLSNQLQSADVLGH